MRSSAASAVCCSLLALFTLWARPAFAAEQHVVYDLLVDGSLVGTRDVTVKYLQRPSGERHVLESYTELSLGGAHVESRCSGLSTPTSAQFSSATERAGERSSVAAKELPQGGWQLTVATGTKQVERSEASVRASTLDLMDPSRVALLEGAGPFGLLIAETGDVVVGTLSPAEPASITVGGQKVSTNRYTLSGESGSARFYLTSDGLLVRSEVSWLGLSVVGVLRELPEARDYGAVETIDGLGARVKEGEL
jgi:hypothetical protein